VVGTRSARDRSIVQDFVGSRHRRVDARAAVALDFAKKAWP
jgi:hypothetical protein